MPKKLKILNVNFNVSVTYQEDVDNGKAPETLYFNDNANFDLLNERALDKMVREKGYLAALVKPVVEQVTKEHVTEVKAAKDFLQSL